ncbi:MAG: protoporphyrinogen oxidase [Cyclobacteriaceae bacterium]
MEKDKIIILGAGITGLATAWWLRKAGYEVSIIEARSEPGGSMQSVRKEGFLIDYGPNSGLDTTPLIRQLVEEAGLTGQLIYANQQSKKRYILKHGSLHALPTSPLAFLSTSLFSTSAKLRLLREPFIGPTDPSQDVSIADFVRHRLGEEFLNNAIDPFISGIYAGNPEKLSVKSALPRLYALEEKYGSLIRGAIAGVRERKKNPEVSKQNAQQFSFKEGMQSLPRALAAGMQESIHYETRVLEIGRTPEGYQLKLESKGEQSTLTTATLLSTIPAHQLAGSISSLDPKLSQHLLALYHPPVMVLYLGFERSAIRQPLDGFGYLIPSRERRPYLGAIWSSIIFEGRAPTGYESFTLFVGGSRHPELPDEDLEARKELVIRDFKQTMMIAESEQPVLVESRLWHKAIPQYNIGYQAHEAYFQQFEAAHPGFFLGGNFRGGISVSDCIKNSGLLKEKIEKHLLAGVKVEGQKRR